MTRFSLQRLVLSCSLAMAGCAVPLGGDKGAEDAPAADGKLDAWEALLDHGTLSFADTNAGQLSPSEAFHAWTFQLTGPGQVTIATGAALEHNLDTVLYLYRRDAASGGWGRYVARNDDADGLWSRIEKELGAGEFRIVVKGYKTELRGPFTVTARCSGSGCPGAAAGPYPAETPVTHGCLDRLERLSASEQLSQSAKELPLGDAAGLSAIEQKAASYFRHYLLPGYDERTVDAAPVQIHTRRLAQGSIVSLTEPGADETEYYVFDAVDALQIRYLNDQVPIVHWYCGRTDETPLDPAVEPDDACAGAMVMHLPREPGTEVTGGGSTDLPVADGVPPIVAEAFDAYYARSGLIAGEEWVDYTYTVWNASPWGQGAEVRLSALGFPPLTYTVGGYQPDFTVLNERNATSVAPVCHASGDRWPSACLFGGDLGVLRASPAFSVSPKVALDPTALTTAQERQILKGFAALGQPMATVAAAFAETDDGIAVQSVVSDNIDYDPFTMYTFHEGDTPMGFIYTIESLELVAVIEDMSIGQCTVR